MATRYLNRAILKLPPRKREAKKGDYGRVLIIGGSEEYVGAPALAARAALAVLRSGADLVTIAAPKKVAWAINRLVPDAITVKLKGRRLGERHILPVLKLAAGHDVLLIGCGIGRKSDAFIKAVVRRVKRPMVIDADALKAIRVQDARDAILTPHRGEYRILMEHSGLPSAMAEGAFRQVRRRLGTDVILLKAPVDIIMGEKKAARNHIHNPVMAKAGTGDVLAGLCAGFLAQTKDLFRSACMAAYLNGAVGNRLFKRYGRTFIASDIVDNIYKVFR